jgi:2-amino-4-hydroxy-6-hydroxymethyldihydropteridine diphosphokinase
MSSEVVFIGLGSNLLNPTQQLKLAVQEISQLPQTKIVKASSLYASKPMGPQNQPDYVNAVCKISTALSPYPLLDALQQIELKHGRVRKEERWGPRTLDLDILLYGSMVEDTERLQLPHPGIADREFVLVPLFEITPDLLMPDGQPLAKWVANCNLNQLRRLQGADTSLQ